jgi:hypothetical protein
VSHSSQFDAADQGKHRQVARAIAALNALSELADPTNPSATLARSVVFSFGGKSMTAIAAITKEKRCPICQTQFVRSRRANQFRSGRLHEEQIYCSAGCRQKAYRRRSITTPRRGVTVAAATYLPATVTQPNISIEITEEFTSKTRGVRPLFRTHAGEVVADAKWPGMYRIKWRGGRVSDMVNYTRAVDALRRASP